MTVTQPDNGDDRRAEDRRSTVDLSWPRDEERRAPGGSSRRREEQERAARSRSVLPAMDPPPPTAAATQTESPRTLAELENDREALREAMAERLRRTKDLPEAEFEAAQARDAEVVTAWAAALRQVEREIAAIRTTTNDD